MENNLGKTSAEGIKAKMLSISLVTSSGSIHSQFLHAGWCVFVKTRYLDSVSHAAIQFSCRHQRLVVISKKLVAEHLIAECIASWLKFQQKQQKRGLGSFLAGTWKIFNRSLPHIRQQNFICIQFKQYLTSVIQRTRRFFYICRTA